MGADLSTAASDDGLGPRDFRAAARGGMESTRLGDFIGDNAPSRRDGADVSKAPRCHIGSAQGFSAFFLCSIALLMKVPTVPPNTEMMVD